MSMFIILFNHFIILLLLLYFCFDLFVSFECSARGKKVPKNTFIRFFSSSIVILLFYSYLDLYASVEYLTRRKGKINWSYCYVNELIIQIGSYRY